MEPGVYSVFIASSDGGYKPIANATSSRIEAYKIAEDYFIKHNVKVYVFLTKTDKSIDYVFSPFKVRVIQNSDYSVFTDKQAFFDYIHDLIDQGIKFSVRYY